MIMTNNLLFSPGNPFSPDYWTKASQGTMTAALLDHLHAGKAAKVYIGTGVSMTQGMSIGVPYEYLQFRGAAIDIAKTLGIQNVLQDICDVQPPAALETLARNTKKSVDTIAQEMAVAAESFRLFAQSLPATTHIKSRAVLVSRQRQKSLKGPGMDDYQQVLADVREAFDNMPEINIPKDDYLFEQIADMYRMRRDENVLVKVGWHGPSQAELRTGKLELGHRSEYYFDYYYRLAETVLDKIYGVELPPMGFIYTKPGCDVRGDVTSPYFGSDKKIIICHFPGNPIELVPLEVQLERLGRYADAAGINSYLRKLVPEAPSVGMAKLMIEHTMSANLDTHRVRRRLSVQGVGPARVENILAPGNDNTALPASVGVAGQVKP